MPEPTSLTDWIDEVKDSTIFKAISAVFDGASFLTGAYDKLKSLFWPDPSTSELIKQAVEQSIRAFLDARAQDLVDEVQGFSRSYAKYLSTKDPGLLPVLIVDLDGCLTKMETRIQQSDPRSAVLVAEAYNLGVPLMAMTTLQDAQYGQFHRPEKPDWPGVMRANRELFERAISFNHRLLGPRIFADQERFAACRYDQGLLFANFRDAIRSGDRTAYIACKTLLETVWRANERLREQVIPDYPAGWFTIRGALSSNRLVADPQTAGVRGVAASTAADRNDLWRLDHESHENARIVHASGRCLTIDDLSLSANDRRVRILPADAGGGEYDYEMFAVEGGRLVHYTRRWHDGAWRRIAVLPGTVASAPAAFLNRAPASAFNHEVFARVGDQVQHFWRSAWDRGWRLGATFGARVRSAPAAFQNQGAGSEFNYEVFFVADGSVRHYWRSWQDGRWREAASIGSGVTFGPAAFQNTVAPALYNYELFVVEGGLVRHYWRDWRDGQWRAGQTFGADVRSAPVAFQNQAAGALHNYEVFVLEGSKVGHYWRSWPDGRWRGGGQVGQGAVFGAAAMQSVDFRDGQLWQILDTTGWKGRASVALRSTRSFRPHDQVDHYTFIKTVQLAAGDALATSNASVPSDLMAVAFQRSDLAPAVDRGSLEPLTAAGRFVRHQDFRAKVTPVASELDRKDATFRLMPGLASGTAVSFEAVNFPGYFLRHRNFELVLAARGSDASFRADATFRRRPGLADPSLVSFESENYPGHFLRHLSGLLSLERGEDAAFARDATFRLQPPRWAAP